MNNLELFNTFWSKLNQYKKDENMLDLFANELIKNKPELTKYKRAIILFLKKIEYIDPLFNGEIGLGDIKVDGVACCWLWNACKDKGGYGRFGIKNNPPKKCSSNRFMLTLVDPDFNIDSELKACHRCDNPGCCNPNHIWPGTYQDNVDDRANKGRTATGINQGLAILTDEQVWVIFDDTDTQQAIADKYGVGISTIHDIKIGKRKLTDPTKNLPKDQYTRSLQGKSGHKAKVSKEIAEEIPRLYATGNYTYIQLGIKFGVSKDTISNIINGKCLKRFDL